MTGLSQKSIYTYHRDTDYSVVIAGGKVGRGRGGGERDKDGGGRRLLGAMSTQCSVRMMCYWAVHSKPVWLCEPMSLQKIWLKIYILYTLLSRFGLVKKNNKFCLFCWLPWQLTRNILSILSWSLGILELTVGFLSFIIFMYVYVGACVFILMHHKFFLALVLVQKNTK